MASILILVCLSHPHPKVTTVTVVSGPYPDKMVDLHLNTTTAWLEFHYINEDISQSYTDLYQLSDIFYGLTQPLPQKRAEYAETI